MDNNGEEPFQVVLNRGNKITFHWHYPFRVYVKRNHFFLWMTKIFRCQFNLGYENIINLLIETRREGGKNLLHFAVECGKALFCWYSWNHLAQKLQTDWHLKLNSLIGVKRSFHFNSVEDRILIKLLAQIGLDINAKDDNGDAPIHLAATKGTDEMLQTY